jgi:hypothetical protein
MHHPGLKRDEVYPGDLRELANWGLRRTSYTSRGDEKFDVTGNGRQYYEWMKAQEGEPWNRSRLRSGGCWTPTRVPRASRSSARPLGGGAVAPKGEVNRIHVCAGRSHGVNRR